MVACFALRSLPHELACRLAKRHGLQNPKDPRNWQIAEKARTLYKKADAAELAMLIFEAILVGCVESTSESKDDDPLATAAGLYKIDAKALRAVVAKEAKGKAQKKAEKTGGKPKSENHLETQSQVTSRTRAGLSLRGQPRFVFRPPLFCAGELKWPVGLSHGYDRTEYDLKDIRPC